MIYRPHNFIIQELVPPEIYNEMGERAWLMLDPHALISLQKLRDAKGRIVINGWHLPDGPYAKFKESGLRDPNSTTGAKRSMHKRGCAFDCKPRDCTPKELYDYVMAHPEEFPYINRVEDINDTPGWFHFDTGNSPYRIQVVNP